MKCRVLVFFGIVGLLAGCTTSSMKGTPFYTGEYEDREGPASDRVNLWPILYYRDPALSVLWPLMEFSPDHLAVRPIYSVYNRGAEDPVYNVLWPIGRFDTANQNYRVFPVYWGDEYFNVFPLYWHDGNPLSGTGYNSFFPFWIWNKTKTGSGLHVMWPLYANYDYAELQGWRLWPLYGSKDYLVGHYRYWAWPVVHSCANSSNAGHGVVPLYFYDKGETRTRFVSLLYGRSITLEADMTSWDYTVPLWYREWDGNTCNWMVFPALSWGEKSEGVSDSWYAAGLVRSASVDNARAHHVIPFYYYRKDGTASAFYSLPWWTATKEDGSGWSASFPFYYGSHSDDGSILMTPLYARKQHGDGSVAWRCYVPFVYLDNTKDAHFMTLLGGRWHMGEQSKWLALPLLSGGYSSADSGRTTWVAGLAGSQWNADQKSQYILPFYLWEEDKYVYTALYGYNQGMTYYATPLLGRYIGDRSGSWIFPLYRHERADSGFVDGSYLLLGKYSKSEQGGSHIFFPLFSYDRWERSYRDDGMLRRQRESKNITYLLFGWDKEGWYYEDTPIGEPKVQTAYWKADGFFPLWSHKVDEDILEGERKETSAWLGFLYDTLYEEKTEKGEQDYLRRRVLWRLVHYEKLNGDSSTDIFPGITVDSHKNGYYKCSVFWRLFRYEKDPENGSKKLDLLFIPLRR